MNFIDARLVVANKLIAIHGVPFSAKRSKLNCINFTILNMPPHRQKEVTSAPLAN